MSEIYTHDHDQLDVAVGERAMPLKAAGPLLTLVWWVSACPSA